MRKTFKYQTDESPPGFPPFKKTSSYINYADTTTSGHFEYSECDPTCGEVGSG